MIHGQRFALSLSRKRGLLVILWSFRLVAWPRETMPSAYDDAGKLALAPALSVDLGRVGVKIRFGQGLLDSGPEYPTSTLRAVGVGPVELLFRNGLRSRGCAR